MSSTINITITGDKETIKTLQALDNEFKNALVPLDRSSRKYLKDIALNFKHDGAVFGEKWPKLHPATIAEKRKLYKEGKSLGVEKPLLRTGALREGFRFTMQGQNISIISNIMSYAGFHNEGGTTTWHGKTVKIPRRVLMAVDATRINMVARTFTDWINELIKKHNAE